jgi:hypothetical protein
MGSPGVIGQALTEGRSMVAQLNLDVGGFGFRGSTESMMGSAAWSWKGAYYIGAEDVGWGWAVETQVPLTQGTWEPVALYKASVHNFSLHCMLQLCPASPLLDRATFGHP